MANDFRVVLRVEELDDDGNCIDVPSEQVLANFYNDESEDSVGEGSDNFFNTVIRKMRE